MKLTEINFHDIKVGDVLEDFIEGVGVVVKIDNTAYPIRFKVDGKIERYTHEGCLQIGDKRPSLYLKIEEL